jgi:hypothetical protein
MMFATLSAYITDFSILSTLETVLSGSQQLRRELEIALSSVPIHPYERLKLEYIDPEIPAVTIEQLSSKKDFCPKTCMSSICSISINLNNNVMSHFFTVTSSELTAMECNAFIQLSSTQNGEQFVVNKKRAGGYLSMLEMIKHIPISLIEREPNETAKKILSHYINVMS